MSDGPHRSLEMRRSWKKLAERADNNVSTQEDVREALEMALERDWRLEVPVILYRRVESILHDTQISLFGIKWWNDLRHCGEQPLATRSGACSWITQY